MNVIEEDSFLSSTEFRDSSKESDTSKEADQVAITIINSLNESAEAKKWYTEQVNNDMHYARNIERAIRVLHYEQHLKSNGTPKERCWAIYRLCSLGVESVLPDQQT